MTDTEAILRRRDELSATYGPWHDSLPLGNGVSTIPQPVASEQIRVRSILQLAADALGSTLSGARVLDLGSAEGVMAIEFALQGADVVAVDGRTGNVEKIQLVRDALALDRLQVMQEDVRQLSRDTHGDFDVVLCLGLLYHLEAESAVALAHRIGDVCRRVAIIDTHISFKSKHSVEADGQTYSGRLVREFDADLEQDLERLSRVAIGNPESLWLTRPSLFNLLANSGFTSVLEARIPRFEKHLDRVTLVAIKGTPHRLASDPDAKPSILRWPERDRSRPHDNQTAVGEIKRVLAPYVPARLRRWIVRHQERHQSKHRP